MGEDGSRCLPLVTSSEGAIGLLVAGPRAEEMMNAIHNGPDFDMLRDVVNGAMARAVRTLEEPGAGPTRGGGNASSTSAVTRPSGTPAAGSSKRPQPTSSEGGPTSGPMQLNVNVYTGRPLEAEDSEQQAVLPAPRAPPSPTAGPVPRPSSQRWPGAPLACRVPQARINRAWMAGQDARGVLRGALRESLAMPELRPPMVPRHWAVLRAAPDRRPGLFKDHSAAGLAITGPEGEVHPRAVWQAFPSQEEALAYAMGAGVELAWA